MIILEIKEKSIWENFLLAFKEKTFLESWNWGEFNKMMGNKIWRLGIFEKDNLVGLALIIKIEAKRGVFLFCPHGPIIKEGFGVIILKSLLEELKKIAKDEGAGFIRIAPILKNSEENIKIFKDLGFRNAPLHIHPEITWELEIRPTEEDLLKNMRKTTRYLIRQAQKNREIEIFQDQTLEGLKIFNSLYQETVERHHFIPFSFDYLKNEFLAFSKDNQISIFLGKYKNEILAGAIIVFWQNIAFYHHGASSLKYSKIPVSYLLQWEAIKEAKKRGCNFYNFWGIAPVVIENCKLKIENLKRHPWRGLTLFKTGFGGYKKEYLKTQDFILSQKYWLNYLIEKIRKRKRGF